jgi:hypothetical protein
MPASLDTEPVEVTPLSHKFGGVFWGRVLTQRHRDTEEGRLLAAFFLYLCMRFLGER